MKVAICLSGHLRTFKETGESFIKNILKPTKADVFIHTWDTINSVDPTWWSEDGDGKKYFALTKDCLDEISKIYAPKKIEVEKSKDFYRPEFAKWNKKSLIKLESVYSALYSNHKSNNLRKQYEAETGISYDVVVRCRPDLEFYNTLDLEDFRDGVIFLPTDINQSKRRGVCDIFAYGSPKIMDIYFDLCNHFDKYFPTKDATFKQRGFIPEFALEAYLNDMNVPIEKSDTYFSIKRINGEYNNIIVKPKKRFNVVIAMAGEGSRFKKAGVDVPKYMIEAKGKTLFEWSMLSLKNFFNSKFIFITRKSNNSVNFIEEKCKALGIKKLAIKEIDYLTAGQAATVLEAEEKILDPSRGVVIYNIDTYVEPTQLHPNQIKGDGWVPAFKAEGGRWSFVKFGDDLKVTEITEKVRISEFGTIGLYYFSSFDLFKKTYNQYKFEGNKEEYIAPMYGLMIKDPLLELYTQILGEEAVHVLGTPEDLAKFCQI